MLTDERIYILMEKARSYRLDGGMKLNLARLVEAEVRKEQADQIAELTRQLAEQCRHDLQAEGKHPSPCARFCEATAFNIEIRGLTNTIADLERQLAEARKDAERIKELEVLAARWTRLVNGLGDVLTGEGMDKTVDAAIKAKEQP